MSSDPGFNLAAQLLAADLNVKAGALTCPSAISAINSAQALLATVHFDGITHDKLSAAQTTQLALSDPFLEPVRLFGTRPSSLLLLSLSLL